MKPWVIFNSALSLDGKTGKREDEKLSNRIDQERIEKLREQSDAIILGKESVFKIKKGEISSNQRKIVLIDPNSELYSDDKLLSQFKGIFVVSSQSEPYKIKKLRERTEVIVIGKYNVNLSQLLKKLYRRGIRKILLEDNDLARRMLEEGLVDEIYLLIAPLFLGKGKEFLPTFKPKKKKKLLLEGITQYGDKVLLHYLVE